MSSHPTASFSRGRRFSLSLNTLVASLAVLAVTAMFNYLASRHFKRWTWSSAGQGDLSALTMQILGATTNDVRVTLYFDPEEPLYEMCHSLLKAYANANSHIAIDVVDYVRDPGKARLVKAKYKLSEVTDRDLVIFDREDGKGPRASVLASELSEYDMQPLLAMQTAEVRRTHFKGELLFTSALLKLIMPRPLKVYFLEGHGEHSPDATEKISGYSQFADVMAENALKWEKLRLEGSSVVPADCNLLVVAGPRSAMQPDVVEKVDHYLKQGGRLLALFNQEGMLRPSGLEKVLQGWGVVVGRDVVYDEKNSWNKRDIVVTRFGSHPLIKPFAKFGLYLLLPRSIRKAPSAGADSPQVELLATTGAEGRIVTDVRSDGIPRRTPNDFVGEVPLMAAIEKGGIRNVSADRGATRIVVVGDSYLFGNEVIESASNRQFATHVLNWLLARDELLVAIPPKPIKDYKIVMTKSQLSAAQWILLGAFPGAVLFLGWLVWLRRRR
jgi:hypothetical protein